MTINESNRILVMPAAGLGDLVMAAPVIRALRACFPESYIAVLAHHSRGAAEIGAAMPYLDEVIDFPLQKYSWSEAAKFFLTAYWRMLFNLRKKKFDMIIILNPNPIRSIIVKMLRPKICLCPSMPGHPAKVGLELISQLGCSKEPLDFGFEIPDVKLDGLLAPALPRPWIGIHPFSAMTWRYWQGFEELIEELGALGGTVFLLGKKTGHQSRRNCVDLVNKLSMTQLLVFISQLDILISCDSGPMHLGFAAGTPTVALFGTVPPQYRMPLVGANKHCAIYHGDTDAPCVPIKERKPQMTNPLDDINADEVYKCVIKLLKQSNP